MCVGNSWPLEWNGGGPRVVRVKLHHDRRDSVRLFGEIRQIVPFVKWDFTYRGTMPTGNLAYTRADVSGRDCWRYRITLNVRKVSDLYD
jgi:hypothetical protein